jgi:hypothetical protein
LSGSGHFTDTATDGPWTIRVTYGDNTGQTNSTVGVPGAFALNHVYRDNGNFTVVVQVTDKFFASSSTSTAVVVNNVAPAVTLPATAGPINEGQSVSISGSFVDPGLNDSQTPGFRAAVNYGDGTPVQNVSNLPFNSGTGQGNFSLNHTYADNPAAAATTFIVTVTVTDKDGAVSAAATTAVTVVNLAPTVSLNSGSNVREGLPATFNGTVSDQGANDGPWTGTVDYGDGSPIANLPLAPGAPPNSPQNTRASFAATHTYAHAGSFTLTVTATDKDGATGSRSVSVHVDPVIVSVAITPTPVFMNAAGQTALFNATVTFSDGSTQSSDGQVHDGVVWTSSNPVAAIIGPEGRATAIGPGVSVLTVSVQEDEASAPFVAHATLTVDTSAPVIAASDVSAEASSAAGAIVTFSFSATDDFDPHPAVSADHASGANYAIGTTAVVVTATDAAGNSNTKTFHVVVADTTLPTITLLGANPATVERGSTFADPGATAADSVAGNLTAAISVSGSVDTAVAGSYTRTYTVSDGFNTTTATRTVNVIATAPPTITLLGPNPMTVEAGSTFTDPGATARSGAGGDLTAQIVATGSVNTLVVGSYTRTYTVSDGPNNATATRIVSVVDTTRPVVTTSGDVTVSATSPAGGPASFTATAADAVDGSLTAACAPASGTVFPIGSTTVTCTATDAHHNTGSAQLIVTVRSPEEMLVRLITQASSSSVLQNALASLGRNNDTAACNQVAAFINQVQAQAGKSLTTAEAASLAAAATDVRMALGCR